MSSLNGIVSPGGGGGGSSTVNPAGFTNGLPGADNKAIRSDGVTGSIQDSAVTIDDSGNITVGAAGVSKVTSANYPASSTDNAVTRFDGTGGNVIQNSLATVDDAGALLVPSNGGAPGIVLNAATTAGAGIRKGSGTTNVQLVNGDGSAYVTCNMNELISENGVQIGSTSGPRLHPSGSGIVLLEKAGGAFAPGFMRMGVFVSAQTGNYSLNDYESFQLFTNEGAGADLAFTLPTAVAGNNYSFFVQSNHYLRVTAGTGDTIRVAAGVSAAAGFVRCTTVGAVLRLVAINATEWIAMYQTGVWTVDA